MNPLTALHLVTELSGAAEILHVWVDDKKNALRSVFSGDRLQQFKRNFKRKQNQKGQTTILIHGGAIETWH